MIVSKEYFAKRIQELTHEKEGISATLQGVGNKIEKLHGKELKLRELALYLAMRYKVEPLLQALGEQLDENFNKKALKIDSRGLEGAHLDDELYLDLNYFGREQKPLVGFRLQENVNGGFVVSLIDYKEGFMQVTPRTFDIDYEKEMGNLAEVLYNWIAETK